MPEVLREISPCQLDYHSSIIQSGVICFSLVHMFQALQLPQALISAVSAQQGRCALLGLSLPMSKSGNRRQTGEGCICTQSTSMTPAQSKAALICRFLL